MPRSKGFRKVCGDPDILCSEDTRRKGKKVSAVERVPPQQALAKDTRPPGLQTKNNNPSLRERALVLRERRDARQDLALEQ